MNKYRITAENSVFADIEAPSPFYALRAFRTRFPGYMTVTEVSKVIGGRRTETLYRLVNDKVVAGGAAV